MRKHVLFLLSCISGAAIQLMAMATAEAAERFVPGIHCTIDQDTYGFTYISDEGLHSRWLTSTTCGLPTDDVLPPASITYLEVNGNDGSTTYDVDVSACVTFYTQHGAYCGATAHSGTAFTGMYAVTPDLGAFQTYPDDYALVSIRLPTSTSGPYNDGSVAGVYYW